ARYKSSGQLDPKFGTHGYTEIKQVVGLPDAVLNQKDGKLLIASGPRTDQGPPAVVRLLRNGRLDSHFGRGGIVSFGDGVTALASQEDGKILVGRGYNEWALDRLIGGNNCVVPGVRSDTVTRAVAALKSSYCSRGRISTRYSGKVARGRVISTLPTRGARLPGGAVVGLVVSRGRPTHRS